MKDALKGAPTRTRSGYCVYTSSIWTGTPADLEPSQASARASSSIQRDDNDPPNQHDSKDRWLRTTGELNRYNLILQKGGQEALADALAKENGKSYYRFGLNLACSVKVAALQKPGKPYVFLMAVRLKAKASTPLDYRFTVIRFNLALIPSPTRSGTCGWSGLPYRGLHPEWTEAALESWPQPSWPQPE